jgi:hypothetical protein
MAGIEGVRPVVGADLRSESVSIWVGGVRWEASSCEETATECFTEALGRFDGRSISVAGLAILNLQ